MAFLLAFVVVITVMSVSQAVPISAPHHPMFRNPASGLMKSRQYDVNIPGLLRVSGQRNYPFGYQSASAVVPFQQQQQRWMPSGPLTRIQPIPPFCIPCSDTARSFGYEPFAQNRVLFPSFTINGGISSNPPTQSSSMDWMNWWNNPFGFLFPQQSIPQRPIWSFVCCPKTTTTTVKPTTVAPVTSTATATTTTVIPTTSATTSTASPTTTAAPATTEASTTTAAAATTVAPTTAAPATTVAPTTAAPATTVAPTTAAPATTVAPTTAAPATTEAPTTAAPATTVAPTTAAPATTEASTTTAAPATTEASTTAATPPPAERSFVSGTNSNSLPTDAIPLSGLKLLMNLFPPSYISFLRR